MTTLSNSTATSPVSDRSALDNAKDVARKVPTSGVAPGFATLAGGFLTKTQMPVLVGRSFAGSNGAGACAAVGLVVGQRVLALWDAAGLIANPSGSFESVVSVADQLQQTNAADLSASKFTALLL